MRLTHLHLELRLRIREVSLHFSIPVDCVVLIAIPSVQIDPIELIELRTADLVLRKPGQMNQVDG